MSRKPIIIGDHALVHWLERVKGIDLSPIRAEIVATVADAMNAGATRVVIDGFIYELDPKQRRLVTVLPKGGKAPRHPGADMGRVLARIPERAK
jgi:hypothetical protein